MKCKTLLLATAAIFAVAGSARAANVAVAESVEYAKVCDAYGASYFYLPGSDTCLNIDGDVEFDTFFNSIKQESSGSIVPSVGRESANEDDINWCSGRAPRSS